MAIRFLRGLEESPHSLYRDTSGGFTAIGSNTEKAFSAATMEFLRAPADGLAELVLVQVGNEVPSVLQATLAPKSAKWPTRRRLLLATANPTSRRNIEEKKGCDGSDVSSTA